MLRSKIFIQDNSGAITFRVITSFNNRKYKPYFFPRLVVWGTIYKYYKFKEKKLQNFVKSNKKTNKKNFVLITGTKKPLNRKNGLVLQWIKTQGILVSGRKGELKSKRVKGTIAKEVLFFDFNKLRHLKDKLI